ncbi:VOC family protein [Micromonospora sonchi]|uniref:VOC family protein n=1 Tax=Micromonospora sonchi TaxID=1763543 RepID=UPI001E5C0475|nr:VOC family protein [Micromonospora sonchi]
MAVAVVAMAMCGAGLPLRDGWIAVASRIPKAGIGARLRLIGFQRVDGYQPPSWPAQRSPQQLHLDFAVDNVDEAEAEAMVLALGATKADFQPGGDRWRVYLDPAGHPFCLLRG